MERETKIIKITNELILGRDFYSISEFLKFLSIAIGNDGRLLRKDSEVTVEMRIEAPNR